MLRDRKAVISNANFDALALSHCCLNVIEEIKLDRVNIRVNFDGVDRLQVANRLNKLLVLLALLRHVVAPDGVLLDRLACRCEGEIVLFFIGQCEVHIGTIREAVAQHEVHLIVKHLEGLIQDIA